VYVSFAKIQLQTHSHTYQVVRKEMGTNETLHFDGSGMFDNDRNFLPGLKAKKNKQSEGST
jgi:hypothetical protein